jgi:putative autotransporter adhesin-like protein
MVKQWKSMLGGAAVAALLIIPAGADNSWTTGPWRSYPVKSVKMDTIVGRLRVEVKAEGPITLQISGVKARVDAMTVRTEGGQLVITGENDNAVWDWHKWFDFSDTHQDAKDLDVHLVVPKGTEVRVGDMIGDATIGDTDGDIRFEAVDSTTTIGRVKNARISMAGAGKIAMTDVMGELKLEIAGSGKIKAQSAQSVRADVAGSGSADLGAIKGGLSLDIAGSGDFNASKVNGPVQVDIVGAGSVHIPQGTANPLHVDIMGAGDFVFGGEAVDPHISAMGSGRVKLRSYRGKMDSDGMVDVQVGPEGFEPPAPPAEPAPPAPPAPPKKH